MREHIARGKQRPVPRELAGTLADDLQPPYPRRREDFELCQTAGEWLHGQLLQWVCQHYERQPGGLADLIQKIAKIYGTQPTPNLVRALVKWDVPALFYTFFDGLLDGCVTHGESRFTDIVYTLDEPRAADSKRIGKDSLLILVRGSVANAKSLVLTESDHQRLTASIVKMEQEYEAIAKQVGRCVLFMGVSPRDPLVRQLSYKLLESGRRRQGPTFFVSKEHTEVDDAYWAQFDVQWLRSGSRRAHSCDSSRSLAMSTAAPALTSDARPMTSPYKELSYYEESDSANFAGREQDVHHLLSRVVISRAFVLYARSGLGKTSVLLAGLFPELRKRDYRPIYVRTLDDPLRDLKAAVARECGLSAEGNSLRSLLQQDCQNGSPVIALDQFEEFFIRFRDQPAKRAEFVRETAAVIADESVDAHLVFSVREDYLAALDDLQRRLPHLFTQSYRLMPLTAFGAREAIVRPLLMNQVPYDESLVTRLVDELAKFDFESARLQITCAELYRSAFERKGVQIHLSEEDLGLLEKQLRELEWKSSVETYGSAIASSPLTAPHGALLGGVFQRYLQRAIAPVEERHPFLSRVVLDEMITRQETKYAIPLGELAPRITSTQEALRDVLESLADRNLVRVGTRAGEPWYEIVHECLVPEIRRWLALNEDFSGFRDARELIVTGSRRPGWRKQTAMLLPREQLLNVIAPHGERLKLDATEVRFVLRSAIYHRADDLPFWASKYDGDLAKLIRTLLDDPSPEMRAAAAAAAGRLELREEAIVEKCRQLALKPDEPSQVRRAAGETLAVIATDEQLATLRRECRWRNTPVHVRELLADLALRNRLRPACGFWGRSMAKRHARKRLMREHAADIEADRWAATQAGSMGRAGMGIHHRPRFQRPLNLVGFIPFLVSISHVHPGRLLSPP